MFSCIPCSSFFSNAHDWLTNRTVNERKIAQKIIDFFPTQRGPIQPGYEGDLEADITLIRNNPKLRRLAAKIERLQIETQVLNGDLNPVGCDYKDLGNQKIFEAMRNVGVSENFLCLHPRFLEVAKANFWDVMWPWMGTQFNITTDADGVDMLHFNLVKEDGFIESISWAELYQRSEFDKSGKITNFRLSDVGIREGSNATSLKYTPTKEVKNPEGKCIVQIRASFLAHLNVPSSIDVGQGGHGFTSIIRPSETETETSELYNHGLFPTNFSDLGYRFARAVPGVIKTDGDDHISRVLSGKNQTVTKQYIIEDDVAGETPCLLTVLNSFLANNLNLNEELTGELEANGGLTMESFHQALLDKNMDYVMWVADFLRRVREENPEADFPVLTKQGKVDFLIDFVEKNKHKQYFDVLERNCTWAASRDELLVTLFMGATYDEGELYRIFPEEKSDRAWHDVQLSVLERVKIWALRWLIQFLAFSPTGRVLGRSEHLEGVPAREAVSWARTARRLAQHLFTWDWTYSTPFDEMVKPPLNRREIEVL